MTRMTALQIKQLNFMNEAARKSTLGTRLDALEFGDVVSPSAGTVAPYSVVMYETHPAIGTATYVHAAIALGAAAQDIATGITNPDYARFLSVKGNATMSGNVIITGTDINGAACTDTIALSNSSEVAGDVAFKTVTNINVPIKTNSSGDTVSVGVGNKFGFPIAIPNASAVLAKSFDLVVDAGTVTAGTTAKTSVYSPAGAASLNGTKLLQLWFVA